MYVELIRLVPVICMSNLGLTFRKTRNKQNVQRYTDGRCIFIRYLKADQSLLENMYLYVCMNNTMQCNICDIRWYLFPDSCQLFITNYVDVLYRYGIPNVLQISS